MDNLKNNLKSEYFLTTLHAKKENLAELKKLRKIHVQKSEELLKLILAAEQEIKSNTFSQAEADNWEEYFLSKPEEIEKQITVNEKLWNKHFDCFNLQIMSGALAARNKLKSLEAVTV